MGAEALKLVGAIQIRLANWGAPCINQRLSCGTVLISANDGRGQLSLEQQTEYIYVMLTCMYKICI